MLVSLLNVVLHSQTSHIHMLCFVLLLLTWMAAAKPPVAETYDCDSGCNHGLKPVCGTDQVTYWHECYAVCQQVTIARYGACTAAPPTQPFQQKTDGKATAKQLKRFSTEGFLFTASLQLVDGSDADDADDDEGDDESSGDRSNDDLADNPWHPVRVTADGDCYVYSEALPELDEDAELPDDEEQGGDKQKQPFDPQSIIGSDTSSVVANTRDWRYRTMGDFGGCSATVVSRTSILTAAHCIVHGGKWKTLKDFIPARQGHNWPYGSFKVEYVELFQEWIDSNRMSLDFAVVTLQPNSQGWYVGDVVGRKRIRSAARMGDSAWIVGYPGVTRDGVTMYHSGRCEVWGSPAARFRRRGNFIDHRCDTQGGNSGSGISYQSYVYGVHTNGNIRRRGYNHGVALSGSRLLAARRWSHPYFQIVSKSGKAKGMCLGSDRGTGNAILWACTGGSNQLWRWTDADDPGHGELIGYYDGKCLDYFRGVPVNLHVSACRNYRDQLWDYSASAQTITTRWGDSRRIACACPDGTGGTRRWYNVHLDPPSDSSDQRWEIRYV